MTKLTSSSRLKVKRDTFFLPDQSGGVYFRNNVSSFQMEGATIYQWIEKLMPMFNGEKTLEDLTVGLTPPYRNRVYEIGETLYKNGFVRDIGQDIPHQLTSNVLHHYASQIEFIENFVESGAFRFQQYRQAKVLTIGSGDFIVSTVSSLLESGLPKFHVMVTDTPPTNRQRLNELVDKAKMTDPEVEVEVVSFQKEEGRSFWREALKPYDWVLYVSQDGNIKELRDLNLVCKEEGKAFIPAICLDQVGLAGPLVHPESDGCWESAWRRLHQTEVTMNKQPQTFSPIAGSLLANVTVFEFFKKVTGVAGTNQGNQIYLLDLETLEGDWLSFLTHPLVTTKMETPRQVEDLDARLKQETERNDPKSYLLDYFSRLTSEETGIFHIWEERNLSQLPLAQCYVQAVNPLSEGPAELLTEIICGGLTHEEAKREAGLTGIEMYVSKMMDSLVKAGSNNELAFFSRSFIGIGAGETIEEAVCRGLQAYLEEELRNRKVDQLKTISHMELGSMEDRHCRFYLNSLTTLNSIPAIGIEEEIHGFPVIRVRSNDRWYTRVGLNTTLALRSALQQALMDAQNQVNFKDRQVVKPSVFLKNNSSKLEIPSCEEITQFELYQSAIQVLHSNNKRLSVYDLSLEPFLKQPELAGVFGVQLREGES
ncbi:putative thiazole-containing bacteriocin maturation protein [Neobacillus ginsengisoli]|uniref:Thiazole-containing bacteriocin maturation protein n=1 Tax=Neobacillus ginsengisoli TaxID=904295 RepID=A0ABT9XWV9_9BACI|nr:putative thiazole-containing bacteriocin maturation protein [Neobacillus ginsengisoli]MDQ0200065.1 putative thiazole-containing bacteriocin maturation protein [Neobacillus ginsengisoli]